MQHRPVFGASVADVALYRAESAASTHMIIEFAVMYTLLAERHQSLTPTSSYCQPGDWSVTWRGISSHVVRFFHV